jgi:S1-C subfamily serine protease
MTQEVADGVRQSVVRVEGEACGRLQEGTGFFVGDGVVVTNAHVVAGEDDSIIELADGSQAEAVVVAFDPARDLAVLATGADAPALAIGSGEVGDVGGVFGHPGGGPLEISPFEVGEEITASGRDIYDQTATQREVLVLAADLAPGDSGSALVDPDGQVVGVAFAVAPDRAGVAYALAVSELQAVLGGDLSQRVGTGDCLI